MLSSVPIFSSSIPPSRRLISLLSFSFEMPSFLILFGASIAREYSYLISRDSISYTRLRINIIYEDFEKDFHLFGRYHTVLSTKIIACRNRPRERCACAKERQPYTSPNSFSPSVTDEPCRLPLSRCLFPTKARACPQTEKEPRSPVLHGSFLVPVYVRALYRKSNGCR